jgi:propionyl-CoA carboxylase alpha chain
VRTYLPPEEGTEAGITVRVDSGLVEGGEVSIYYDPMIAKLITHAPTRSLAVAAQARALDAFAIDGIRHNIPFLSTLMTHPRWREGRLSTAFIADEFPDGFSNRAPEGQAARRFAAVAGAIDHLLNQRKRGISGQLRAARPVAFDATRVAVVGDLRFTFSIVTTGGGALLRFSDGGLCEVRSGWRPGAPVWSGTIDGASVAFQARPRSNGVVLVHGGAIAEVQVFTTREAELAALMLVKASGDSGKFVLCPMPGLVTAIRVREGQEIKAGEALAVVEAMKMENVLLAERDGTIKSILAKAGDSIAVDAVLMEFA